MSLNSVVGIRHLHYMATDSLLPFPDLAAIGTSSLCLVFLVDSWQVLGFHSPLCNPPEDL